MSDDKNSKIEISYNDLVKQIIDAFTRKDLEKLHILENQAIENAVMAYDRLFAEIGIAIYGIRKLDSKMHISSKESWVNNSKEILKILHSFLETENVEQKKINISKVIQIIKDTDKQLGRYVTHVISDASVKLASSAYAFGLSASQASSLFNCDKEQLMNYLGATKMSDEDKQFKSIKERLHLLEVMSKNDKIWK